MAVDVDENGFIIRDQYDIGVPMRPAPEGWVYPGGPENAWATGTRGDYSQVTQPRIHYRSGTINVFGEYVVDGRGEARRG